MYLFNNIKGQKWKKPVNILKKGFLKTDLRFSLPFQNFMPHIEIMKFCQTDWSLPYSRLFAELTFRLQQGQQRGPT